ncbi:MAG: hypothetical protein ABII82_15895 [Verrucomicrobiota bacterium]
MKTPASPARPFTFLAVLTTILILVIAGCKPARVSGPEAGSSADTAQEVAGRLDWSAWQRWVQTPPKIALVSRIDEDTRGLIERQSALFLAVIGDTGTSAEPLPETEIARLQDAFLASSSRTANSPVPAVERWDRYANAVQRIQPGGIATSINTLEAYVRRDRQDLASQATATGDSGRQARGDLNWIDSAVMPIIQRLKKHEAAAKPALSPDQARAQWKTFESDSLPKIARAIEAATTASADVGPDGTYRLTGKGRLVAIVTVAGRDLYFPAEPATPGLRFLQ